MVHTTGSAAEIGGLLLAETSPRAHGIMDALRKAGEIIGKQGSAALAAVQDAAVEELRSQVASLLEQLAAAVGEKKTLTESHAQEMERLSQHVTLLQGQLDAEKLSNEQAVLSLQAAKAEAQRLRTALSTAPSSEKLSALTSELSQQAAELTSTQKNLITAETRARQLEEELRQYKTEIDRKHAERLAELRLGGELDKKKIADLSAQLKVLQEAHAQVREELGACRTAAQAAPPPSLSPDPVLLTTPISYQVTPLEPPLAALPPSSLSLPDTYTPPSMTATLGILRKVAASNPGSRTLAYFAEHPLSLWLHAMRESRMRWGSAPTKEAPRKGSVTPRFSYGLIQLLDDTAAGLAKRRALLGSFADKIEPIAESTGAPSPTSKRLLDTEDPGAHYVALFLMTFGRHMGDYFNMSAFLQGSPLAVDEAKRKATTDSKLIADWVNAKSTALVPAPARLLRLYGGASSIPGMANSIRSGHADESTAWLDKYAAEWAAQEAVNDAKRA